MTRGGQGRKGGKWRATPDISTKQTGRGAKGGVQSSAPGTAWERTRGSLGVRRPSAHGRLCDTEGPATWTWLEAQGHRGPAG